VFPWRREFYRGRWMGEIRHLPYFDSGTRGRKKIVAE
jgi:hypothetical protein